MFRISKKMLINPEAVRKVAMALSQKIDKSREETTYRLGGIESIVNILNYMDRDQGNEFLDFIAQEDPEIIEKVNELLYTFEELLNLNKREMQTLLSHVNNDTCIATALRGMNEGKQKSILKAVSKK